MTLTMIGKADTWLQVSEQCLHSAGMRVCSSFAVHRHALTCCAFVRCCLWPKQKGMARRDAGDHSGAVRMYSTAIKVDPNCHMVLSCTVRSVLPALLSYHGSCTHQAYLLRGTCRARLQTYDKARQDIESYLKRRHEHEVCARYNLALVHSCLGDHVAALLELNTAIVSTTQRVWISGKPLHAY